MKSKHQCQCGMLVETECNALVDIDDMVVIEYMPKYFRESHILARNKGIYPHNGAIRAAVSSICAEEIMQDDPEWACIVNEDPKP
jgi:hypothetical protein